MISLSAKIRKILGKKTKTLRKKGLLPAVIYGPKIKPLSLEIDYKDFEKVYREAGESSLISLKIDPSTRASTERFDRPERLTAEGLSRTSSGKQQKSQVLIHEIQKDPLSGQFLHVDFYQPLLTEEVEAKVPLIFKGEALAVKELGGTLVKNITEIEVKALPQNLPKEIKVDITQLKNLEDHILIKDLKLEKEIKILKDPKEIVAWVASPEKVEEELEKPIEEKIEEVEKVEEKKEKESAEK